jgi:uncharacterized delta-60 repeat protein
MFKFYIFLFCFLLSHYDSMAQSFSLDTTYGISGKRFTYNDCNNSVLLPDNKLLVAAGLTATFGIPSPAIGIRKYNPNGGVDSTFGVAGIGLFTSPSVNDRYFLSGMTVQPDGKIIVAGRVHKIGGFVYYYDFCLLRFNANGTVDESFGNKGLVVKSLNNDYSLKELFDDVVVDNKGRILAAGYTEDDNDEKQDAVAMRFLTNGQIDSTFATQGVLKLNIADSDYFSHVKSLNDNSILLAGVSTILIPSQVMLIVKLDENGRFDASFGTNGRATIDFESGRKSVANIFLKPNNKIMVVGNAVVNTITDNIAFAQLNSNGKLDSTFSGDGKNMIIATVPNHYPAGGNHVSLLPDNKFLVFSTTKKNDSSNNYDVAVVKINADATLDRTFANSGVFLYETTTESEYAYGMHPQNDGKVLLLVNSWNSNVVYAGNIYRYKNAFTPTNVLNYDLQTEITVYPNPVTDQLSIESNQSIQKVEIYNLDGRKIKTIKAHFNEIDVSGINNGLYFLSIYVEDQVFIKKVLKK